MRVVRLQSESLRVTLSVNTYPDYRANIINVGIGIGNEVTSPHYEIHYDNEGKFLEYGTFTHDSKEINGKVYYDVVECNTSNDVNGKPTIPTQLFYNKTCGILQINRDGENFLTLNQ